MAREHNPLRARKALREVNAITVKRHLVINDRDSDKCSVSKGRSRMSFVHLVPLIPLSPPKSENPTLLPVICAVYKSFCQRAEREWAVQDAEAKKTARETPSVVVSSRRRGAQSRVCNAGGPRAPPECAEGGKKTRRKHPQSHPRPLGDDRAAGDVST